MRRINGGWVFNPDEEERVLSAESDEIAMLRAAAHVRGCCLVGHTCKNGDRCRGRCQSCHTDAMAVWDGKKRVLDRQADEFLARHDGIPVLPSAADDCSLEKVLVQAVVEALTKAGIIF